MESKNLASPILKFDLRDFLKHKENDKWMNHELFNRDKKKPQS